MTVKNKGGGGGGWEREYYKFPYNPILNYPNIYFKKELKGKNNNLPFIECLI